MGTHLSGIFQLILFHNIHMHRNWLWFLFKYFRCSKSEVSAIAMHTFYLDRTNSRNKLTILLRTDINSFLVKFVRIPKIALTIIWNVAYLAKLHYMCVTPFHISMNFLWRILDYIPAAAELRTYKVAAVSHSISISSSDISSVEHIPVVTLLLSLLLILSVSLLVLLE